jgi:hypothetical protein
MQAGLAAGHLADEVRLAPSRGRLDVGELCGDRVAVLDADGARVVVQQQVVVADGEAWKEFICRDDPKGLE